MNFEREDKIISDFLKSLGPWNDFVAIGGGYALFVYKLYLAKQDLNNPPVGTRDIDSLISRKIPNKPQNNIANYLSEAGFVPVFRDLSDPPTESYIKEIEGIEIEIEFLTDDSVRFNKGANIAISGIVAQPLSYLSLYTNHFKNWFWATRKLSKFADHK